MLSKLTSKFRVDRKLYAVTKGAYLGEHLLLIEHNDDTGHFLVMPDLAIKTISYDDFSRGVKNGVLDVIGALPKDVMKACIEQYNILKKKRDNAMI